MEKPSGALLREAVLTEGIDPYRGKNAWRVALSGDRWNVFAGNREYLYVADFSYGHVPLGPPEIEAEPKGDISATLCGVVSAPVELSSSTEADVFSTLGRDDARGSDVAGIYSMLDYEHDDSYARLGGSYRLAVVPCEGMDDRYSVVYLGGARINASAWPSGRLKAWLRPTAFPTVYDVEWCDAEGEWMLRDVQAEFDRLAQTLTVKFPYQGASVRFRKE